MIYQFERSRIERCDGCDFFYGGVDGMSYKYGYCTRHEDIIDGHKTPQDNDCPLVAISKTETISCEWCKNDECYMSGQDFNCPAIPCEDCKYSIKFDNFCRHCGRKLK